MQLLLNGYINQLNYHQAKLTSSRKRNEQRKGISFTSKKKYIDSSQEEYRVKRNSCVLVN